MNKASYLRYSGHLGAILFNIGLVGILFVTGTVFMPVLWLIILLMLGVIAFYATLFSAGTVWISEVFRNFMSNTFGVLFSEDSSSLMSTLFEYAPTIMIVTGIVLALAALFLFFDRGNPKSKSRFISILVMAILFVILVIIFVVSVVNGGAA